MHRKVALQLKGKTCYVVALEGASTGRAELVLKRCGKVPVRTGRIFSWQKMHFSEPVPVQRRMDFTMATQYTSAKRLYYSAEKYYRVPVLVRTKTTFTVVP
jgi:hypothetical protein